MNAVGNRAVFLDRDGTINTDTNYGFRLSDLRFEEGAVEGLRLMQRKEYKLIIITDQSGIARGLFREADMHRFNEELLDRLKLRGVYIRGIYYCPHHPEGKIAKYRKVCKCRKPEIGLIKIASAEHRIDLSQSYMVGDKMRDILTGKNAGLTTILVKTGHAGNDSQEENEPDFTAKDLVGTARFLR